MVGKQQDWSLREFDQEIKKAKKRGQVVRFIKGPLPLEWLSQCARLGGKCINVGMALFYSHGMNGSPVVLARRLRSTFGVGDSSSRYALRLMEKAGLVRVERRTGCAPRVDILRVGDLSHTKNNGEREQELGDLDTSEIHQTSDNL